MKIGGAPNVEKLWIPKGQNENNSTVNSEDKSYENNNSKY